MTEGPQHAAELLRATLAIQETLTGLEKWTLEDEPLGLAYWLFVLGGHLHVLCEDLKEREREMDPLACIDKEDLKNARDHGIPDDVISEVARSRMDDMVKAMERAWNVGAHIAHMGSVLADQAGLPHPFRTNIRVSVKSAKITDIKQDAALDKETPKRSHKLRRKPKG